MNIYFQELKNYYRVTLIWATALSLMSFGFLSMFGGFSSDVVSLKHLLASYPPQLLTALNLQVGIFFTIIGFFAYILTFIWLAGGMQAMNLGMGVLSKEVSGKTADFLLTKPVTRFSVLTQKLAAAITLLVFTNIVFVSVTLLSATMFSKDSFDHTVFFLAAGTLLLVQLIFMALGFLLAAVIPKIKTVLSYTLPIVFGLFILGLFGNVIGKEEIYYLTPFKYFDVIYVVHHTSYEPKYLWITLGVTVISIILGYIAFMMKDIEAAN